MITTHRRKYVAVSLRKDLMRAKILTDKDILTPDGKKLFYLLGGRIEEGLTRDEMSAL